LQPTADSTPNAVLVRAQILEIPENLMPRLDGLNAGEKESSGFGVLSAEQTRALLARVNQTDGATVIAAPQVTTLSGRQAQVQVIEMFNGHNGQSYFTGPIVDVTPTISPDNQAVELTVDARLNVRKPRP
jgi:type II secretory pathway component GspD/PulD (secretin)